MRYAKDPSKKKWEVESMMNRVEILGIQIDNVSWEEALLRVRDMIRSESSHQIVTPAIEQIVLARRDPEFRRVLKDADFVVADGMPLVLHRDGIKHPCRRGLRGSIWFPLFVESHRKKMPRFFYWVAMKGWPKKPRKNCRNKFQDYGLPELIFPRLVSRRIRKRLRKRSAWYNRPPPRLYSWRWVVRSRKNGFTGTRNDWGRHC